MTENEKLIDFLIALGGLVALIEALVGLIFPRWFSWVGSIFGIIFSLITLLSVLSPENKSVEWYFSLYDHDWLLYIILAILLMIFGSVIGAVIVILGVILDFLLDFF
ncbi:MAG: hypothetical protein ACOC44_18070 [Promethearchaeia archaeon]